MHARRRRRPPVRGVRPGGRRDGTGAAGTIRRLRSKTPVVTYALIALNVLMFILQNASTDVERALTLWSPAVADGDLYRLVTSAF